MLISTTLFGATCDLGEDVRKLPKLTSEIYSSWEIAEAAQDTSDKKGMIKKIQKARDLSLHIMLHDDVNSSMVGSAFKVIESLDELKEHVEETW
ncbi:MAG: hypothetical protein ACRC5T_14105 [Cetobacterium sp.]